MSTIVCGGSRLVARSSALRSIATSSSSPLRSCLGDFRTCLPNRRGGSKSVDSGRREERKKNMGVNPSVKATQPWWTPEIVIAEKYTETSERQLESSVKSLSMLNYRTQPILFRAGVPSGFKEKTNEREGVLCLTHQAADNQAITLRNIILILRYYQTTFQTVTKKSCHRRTVLTY